MNYSNFQFSLPKGRYFAQVESWSREDLRRLQFKRMKEQIDFIYQNSPYYQRVFREQLLTPEDFNSLEDLQKVPFVNKHIMGESQAKHPPYGEFLCQPVENCVRFFMTTGTTAVPRKFIYTARDWYDIACGAFARFAWSFGAGPQDRAFIAFGYGTFVGFWGAHHGFEQIGALVYSGGGFPSNIRLRLMRDLKATVLVATPTYAAHLLEIARQENIDPRSIGVEKIVVAGEPGGSIPETRNWLEENWGAKVYDTYGINELQIYTAGECTEQDGLHIPEDWLRVEVINETGEPVRPGERGELVLSNLVGKSMPLLRFRTGDIVTLDDTPCACGRNMVRLRSGVVGRTDDMAHFKGVNLFPSTIESAIRKIPGLGPEFQAALETIDNIDQLAIQVEPLSADLAEVEKERLRKTVADEIKFATNITPKVQMVSPGTLPRFELKAKRFADKRLKK